MARLSTRTLTGVSRSEDDPGRSQPARDAAAAMRPELDQLRQHIESVAADHRRDIASISD